MSDLVQRWRDGFDSYRRPTEPIRTCEYDVALIPDDTTARRFVEQQHYSGNYSAARWRFGLFHQAQLVGVAVYSHPMCNKVITGTLGISNHRDGAELGRFVLLDRVPGNGESWFIAQTFRTLRGLGLAGVVSFSDPARRVNASGVEVFGGHLGTIYQATNARYVGRITPRTLKLMPDCRVISPRLLQKIRSTDQGVEYGVRQLVAAGTDEPASREPGYLTAWLGRWTGGLCRNQRHRGCYKYVWAFHKGLQLPEALPYPKQKDAARRLHASHTHADSR